MLSPSGRVRLYQWVSRGFRVSRQGSPPEKAAVYGTRRVENPGGNDRFALMLLDEIIDATVDEKVPIGTLLRKCLVLEQQVKNEKFRAWLNHELDGYDQIEELPPYRVFNCVNKGVFFRGASVLNDQPIPLDVMEEQDRELIEKAYLNQPAASYENRPNKSANATLPWNPSLTAKYQTKFFRPPTVLNRAWQEIPGSILVGLLEQIRTRVLRFALDLKDNLPVNAPDPKQVSAAVVERSVVNNIYGGNILIASHAEHISQMAHTTIAVGDIEGLKRALSTLGVTDKGLKELEADIKADKTNGQPSIGPRIKGWLADIGQYLGKEGAKAGIDVAKKLATKWILQHYGMDLG
jgi:AbiTii